MAQSLVVNGPSSSKISAGLANKRDFDSHGRHTISGLYYVMAASIGLLTTILIMLWPKKGKKLAV